jgi:hypothetical protein
MLKDKIKIKKIRKKNQKRGKKPLFQLTMLCDE